ncbi:MAG TPA: ubiquinol-cytochrome c reductase iron-sulfur subunit [Thermoguttaceae bacterium]|nr:ubiquinol-cytochrome c reductase iron-sulfur subunit [Thermoguttaceae bacterium]
MAGLLAAGVTVTIGALLYPVVRFLWPRPVTQSGADSIIAPYRVGQLKPDSEGRWPKAFNFGGKPCLVVLTPDGEKRLGRGEAVRQEDVRAFNAICTHTDCTVDYRPKKGEIFCACHNGVYNLDGRNVSGPPPRPLEVYKVALRGEVAGQEEIIVSRT